MINNSPFLKDDSFFFFFFLLWQYLVCISKWLTPSDVFACYRCYLIMQQSFLHHPNFIPLYTLLFVLPYSKLPRSPKFTQMPPLVPSIMSKKDFRLLRQQRSPRMIGFLYMIFYSKSRFFAKAKRLLQLSCVAAVLPLTLLKIFLHSFLSLLP